MTDIQQFIEDALRQALTAIVEHGATIRHAAEEAAVAFL
jgi:hypothetical protein